MNVVMNVVLSVGGLQVQYDDRKVVDGFDLEVGPGEVVALMGPSGSGKSSILNCIVGLQVPDVGSVLVAGEPMTGQGAGARAALRRTRIGVAYQTASLLPELSVEENVAVTLLFDGWSRDRALAAARVSLDRVGLGDHGTKRVDEVSGGEAHRVALARALVRDSTVLLVADEPTASLDGTNAIAIAQLLVATVRERGIGGLVATHDNRVATLCDRVADLGARLAA